MKIFLTVLLSSLFLQSPQTDFYNLQLTALGGGDIKMSQFKDKIVMIIALNTDQPDIGYLKYLNSLQLSKKDLQIIAVPSIEYGGNKNDNFLTDLKNDHSFSIIITRPEKVKQNESKEQNSVFVWLTQKDENRHFEVGVNRYDQMFFINKKGRLYAILPKGVESAVLEKVINDPVVD